MWPCLKRNSSPKKENLGREWAIALDSSEPNFNSLRQSVTGIVDSSVPCLMTRS